jgi:hypothetical protein
MMATEEARNGWDEADPPPPGSSDGTASWLATRERVDWGGASRHVTGPVHSGRDGVADFVGRRSSEREELAAALALVREHAVDGGTLTFAVLAGWQRVLLGLPAATFRTTTAYGRRGKEAYHYHAGLPGVFERCLAEATDERVPLPSRAARAYLDVAFVHPFADGNARAAMLALYFVLAREGVVLDRAAPILVTARHPYDAAGAASLAGLVELLIDGSG